MKCAIRPPAPWRARPPPSRRPVGALLLPARCQRRPARVPLPQEPWTQVAQVQTVLIEAGKLAARHGPHCAVAIGADLNSIPGSGVYHLITSGSLPPSHPHLRIIAEHVEMPEFGERGEFGGGAAELRQPLILHSA